jgi:hypothetical protein
MSWITATKTGGGLGPRKLQANLDIVGRAILSPVVGLEDHLLPLAFAQGQNELGEQLRRVLGLDVERRQLAKLLHGVAEVLPGPTIDLYEAQGLAVEHVDLVDRVLDDAPEPRIEQLGSLALGDVLDRLDHMRPGIPVLLQHLARDPQEQLRAVEGPRAAFQRVPRLAFGKGTYGLGETNAIAVLHEIPQATSNRLLVGRTEYFESGLVEIDDLDFGNRGPGRLLMLMEMSAEVVDPASVQPVDLRFDGRPVRLPDRVRRFLEEVAVPRLPRSRSLEGPVLLGSSVFHVTDTRRRRSDSANEGSVASLLGPEYPGRLHDLST